MSLEEKPTPTDDELGINSTESTYRNGSSYQESHIYGDAVQGDKVSGDKVEGDKYESHYFISYQVQMLGETLETTRSIEVELTAEQERRIKPNVIQDIVNQL